MRLIDGDALKITLDTFATVVGIGGIYNRRAVLECIDAVPTVGEWISVEDRLPKKPDGYPYSEIRRSYFLVALESGCVESLGFDFDRMEWHCTGSPVTHWMPLPELPKEVKQDDRT